MEMVKGMKGITRAKAVVEAFDVDDAVRLTPTARARVRPLNAV